MDIKLLQLQSHGDERGSLIVLEEGKEIAFSTKRVYYIKGTKKEARRGLHAHKSLKQVAVAIHGSCKFLLDDGVTKQEITLDNSCQGLLIEAAIWREMYDFSKDCILMVLSDDLYNESEYIRDYDEFLNHIKNL